MLGHRSMLWAAGLALSAAVIGLMATGHTPTTPLAATMERDDSDVAWADVRDVLERHCLECHGGHERESDLSFATGGTFAHGGARGRVLDPENLEASRLLEVISYRNPNLAMPPSGQLPADDYAILERWILEGAPWPEEDAGRLADPEAHPLIDDRVDADSDWWAYRPLLDVEPPTVADEHWNGHAIDAFIRAALDDAGLEPVGLATPEQLVRRATFDLIGLPPTPDEVDRFLVSYERDPEAAWTGLIDRLLADDAYGEHWARHWLDQVRYAETNGYERDGTKTNIWRFRDWVIRSLNDDMPYDRFLIEQLAGDELARLRPDSGADDTSLIATGYYRLGVWDDEPADPEQARADELADVVDTTGQIFLGMTVGCARCHDHKADPISQKDYYALTAFFNNITGFGGGRYGQHLGGGMTRPVADAPADGQLTIAQRDAELERLRAAMRAALGDAAPTEAASEVILPDARKGGTDWKYLVGPTPDGATLQAFDDDAWASGRSGFGTKGTPGAIVGTEWKTDRITIRTRFGLDEIPDGAILSVHHDEDADIFINGVPAASFRGYRDSYTDVQLPREAFDALVVGSNTITAICRQTGGGQFLDVGLRSGWLDTDDAWVIRLERARGLDGVDMAEARRLASEIQRVREMPVAEAYPALVVSERGASAPVQHVLMRGSAHAEGDAVMPAVPGVLEWAGEPRMPTPGDDAPSTGRRLAFAEWLVDEGDFITARVMANRLWQFHFGRGICRSSGDFGRLGQAPTHPELLDHLARRLIELDWSLKAMHREIMTSRFYRTSSIPSDELLAKDPRNNLYGRTDPRRLTAEQYRDAVLAVSGLATDTMYGPGVYPPLPEEVLATASRPDAAWGRSSPEDATRRSIYVFMKRSLRPPLLENLDQPDPDLPCPVRFPTNVPTQALITLNGDFVNNAADAFASRVLHETDSRREAIRRGVQLAIGRTPGDAEIDRHLAFVDRLVDRNDLDDQEAMRIHALMLLNLNEFMWVD